MSKLTHPFDPDVLYEFTGDGFVRVSKGDSEGFFTGEGIHISGKIREADPQMCNWVANNPSADTQLATSRLAGRDENMDL